MYTAKTKEEALKHIAEIDTINIATTHTDTIREAHLRLLGQAVPKGCGGCIDDAYYRLLKLKRLLNEHIEKGYLQ